jgi:hypothetical protein
MEFLARIARVHVGRKTVVKSVEGVYRDGKVDLFEAAEVPGGTRVIVTFLPGETIVNLADRGIGREQAADLRHRLSAFVEDWDRPDMDVYDAL